MLEFQHLQTDRLTIASLEQTAAKLQADVDAL